MVLIKRFSPSGAFWIIIVSVLLSLHSAYISRRIAATAPHPKSSSLQWPDAGSNKRCIAASGAHI
jgi:hypothetical protein